MRDVSPSLWQQAPINWRAPVNRGLLAWWRVLPARRAGTVWRDLTARFPGTFVGGTTWQSTGPPQSGGALAFNGSTGQLTTPSMTSPARRITFAAWVNPTSLPSNRGVLQWESNRFIVEPGGTVAAYWTGGDPKSSTATIPVGAWSHIAGSIDTTTLLQTISINGQVVSARTDAGLSGGAFGWSATAVLGSVTGAWFWLGALDDIRIYTRVLEPPEIWALYTASKTGYRHEMLWYDVPAPGIAAAAGGSILRQMMQHSG